MAEKDFLNRRLKYAGDVLSALQHKAGWELIEACDFLNGIPDADEVVECNPELRESIIKLHKEYEKAKQNPTVRNPLAYALYQTWRAVDGARKDGKG